ncbi:MAG: hypothetical protein LBH70_02935 [Spirochaetaceae bacterium]|jgi:hypothetical protein|nr:hypothetical protein [Spirochaetaceae bacterium]
MRKIPGFLCAAAASLAVLSCSNFAMPERIHIKAGINPNIPVSSKFNFTENFQKELTAVFADASTDGEKGIRVLDYRVGGEAGDVQKFLISFPLKEQSLDFEKYLGEDSGLNEEFQNIKQTFTLDPLSTGDDNKISIDMKETIKDILTKTAFPVQPLPGSRGSGSVSPITVNATGFTSLSFHKGSLILTLTLQGANLGGGSITLENFRINSTASSESSYTVSSGRPAVVSFPLAGKTLEKTLSISFSYQSPAAFTLSPEIKFSDDAIIKTAQGISFTDVANKQVGNSTIESGAPSEFVQAKISAGSLNLDRSALKGIGLGLAGLVIMQDDNPGAPAYGGTPLNKGLADVRFSGASGAANLAGKMFNPKPIRVSGVYSLRVERPDTEISFNDKGALEIPVSFSVGEFSTVYISGDQVLDNFNNDRGPDGRPAKKISASFDELAETVSAITINEVGVKMTFGESSIKDLMMTVKSVPFEVNATREIQKGAAEKFTNRTSTPSTPSVGFDIQSNRSVPFYVTLASKNAVAVPVFELERIIPGQEVTIIDCTAEVVFDWKEATIDPGLADDFASGSFPDTTGGFSLSDSEDMETMLKDVEFENIQGYLFFSGPDLNATNTITLNLAAGTDSLYNDSLEIIKEPLALPAKGDESFTGDLEKSNSSLNSPIDFTEVFNGMLEGTPLKITYGMQFKPKNGGSSGITITRAMVDGRDGVNAFKADLVVVVPLKLKAKSGGATIDLTKFLGEMEGQNMLSFVESTGDGLDVAFSTLTLNINLSGAFIENGRLIINRDRDDEAGDIEIPLTGKNISLPLAPKLGPSKRFTPTGVILKLENGGYLNVPPRFGLLSLSINAGIDATIDLKEMSI